MNKHIDVYALLDEKFPFSTQLGFDNAGFLVGDKNKALHRAVVALDITDDVIDFAISIGADLIVSHHPVIFEPLKAITADSVVYRLAASGISAICAHTNLDMACGGVNDALCLAIGLEAVTPVLPEGEAYSARVGKLPKPLSPTDFAAQLKSKLSTRVKFVSANAPVKAVAVCSGSGGSMFDDVAKLGVDAFVTADIKHNIFLEAKHRGISLYDCGHFETENVVIEPLAKLLNDNFGDVFVPYVKNNIEYM